MFDWSPTASCERWEVGNSYVYSPESTVENKQKIILGKLGTTEKFLSVQ